MKIITKYDVKEQVSHNMLELGAGIYTGVILPSNIPGIVIVGAEKHIPAVMYCFEGGTQWLDARAIGNSHLIKNPVRVKIETITTIAL